MIKYSDHSVFSYIDKYPICNTVNTKKVMGRGLALEFKIRFPEYFDFYLNDSKIKHGGDISVFNDKIISLATKEDWKFNSKVIWIENCLINLKTWMNDNNILTVAIPPLGAGYGKLDFENDVKPLIEKHFASDNKTLIVCLSKEDTKEDKFKLNFINSNLNGNTFELLKYFTTNQIEEIQDYIDNGGKLRQLRDLLKIRGISEETYKKIIFSKHEITFDFSL